MEACIGTPRDSCHICTPSRRAPARQIRQVHRARIGCLEPRHRREKAQTHYHQKAMTVRSATLLTLTLMLPSSQAGSLSPDDHQRLATFVDAQRRGGAPRARRQHQQRDAELLDGVREVGRSSQRSWTRWDSGLAGWTAPPKRAGHLCRRASGQRTEVPPHRPPRHGVREGQPLSAVRAGSTSARLVAPASSI